MASKKQYRYCLKCHKKFEVNKQHKFVCKKCLKSNSENYYQEYPLSTEIDIYKRISEQEKIMDLLLC